MSKKILIIHPSQSTCDLLEQHLLKIGHLVTKAICPKVSMNFLKNKTFDIIFTTNIMIGYNGIQAMHLYKNAQKSINDKCQWVFAIKQIESVDMKKMVTEGASFFLAEPFTFEYTKHITQQVSENIHNKLIEIKNIVTALSGVQFGEQKKMLIETRVQRRARDLNLKNISSYLKYFAQNRNDEIKFIISSLTTHTTKFFREQEHYDYLYKHVFSRLVKNNQSIKIWSAASSSGEELYSLVICFIEYCRINKINMHQLKNIEFFGSDIDEITIKKSKKAIYRLDEIQSIPKNIIDRYFDIGTGVNKDYVKIKHFVKRFCTFKQVNLLHDIKNHQNKFDIIFVRNVFIYFSKDDITKISNNLFNTLNDQGILFVGHSESLRGINSNCITVAPSVYQLQSIRTTSVPLVKKEKNKKIECYDFCVTTENMPIKVLIVDDSSTIRKILTRIISSSDKYLVVGSVNDPYEAIDFLKVNPVDVVTLDIHMPKMNGISYLKSCDQSHPPVIVISSVDQNEASEIFTIPNQVAFDFISKPESLDCEAIGKNICASISAAFLNKSKQKHLTNKKITYKSNINKDIIVIGASTGGVQAIENILSKLPKHSPPILIVQHMPAGYTHGFAKRLNKLCEINVSEAKDCEIIKPGNAYIAPGGLHMTAKRNRNRNNVTIAISKNEKHKGFKPSVDILFNSIEKLSQDYNTTAIILTGMGKDGAEGIKRLREANVVTIAQDQESCVVFGMPAEAIRLQGADYVLPLEEIPNFIFAKKPKKHQFKT